MITEPTVVEIQFSTEWIITAHNLFMYNYRIPLKIHA